VIEFARNVLGWADAHSTEADATTTHPVVCIVSLCHIVFCLTDLITSKTPHCNGDWALRLHSLSVLNDTHNLVLVFHLYLPLSSNLFLSLCSTPILCFSYFR